MNTEINNLEDIKKIWREMGTAFHTESYCSTPEALNNKLSLIHIPSPRD